MKVIIKSRARLLLSGQDFALCWFCKKPTQYVLEDARDDSEVWCCPLCLGKEGRIRRFKRKTSYSTTLAKSLKKSQNLHIKSLPDTSREGSSESSQEEEHGF